MAEKVLDETGAEVVRYRKLSARNVPSSEGESSERDSLLRGNTTAGASADHGSYGGIH